MALHGTFDALGSVELLQALNSAGKTGFVTAESFLSGARVRLHLKSGQVVWAEGTSGDGVDAVVYFLDLEQGIYTFRSGEVNGLRNVSKPTETIILQWAVRLDENHRGGQ
ncbi:MAG: DUF4388 domain-containing protein [Armatimonadota bacterium]